MQLEREREERKEEEGGEGRATKETRVQENFAASFLSVPFVLQKAERRKPMEEREWGTIGCTSRTLVLTGITILKLKHVRLDRLRQSQLYHRRFEQVN